MIKENLTFRGQREDEEVILLIHRHPWALVKPGLWVSAAAVIIILMFIFFQVSKPAVWTLFILGSVAALYAIYAWFLWWNNMYLLTNQRVIVISRLGLFSRRVEDYGLDKIQSVASDTAGAAGTVLNFGGVHLAIMGIKDQIAMRYIEDPYDVQEKILTAIKKAEGGAKVNKYDREKSGSDDPKRRLIQH